MSKGKLFGERLIAWYSIDTITRLQDSFKARGWSLEFSKAKDVMNKAIESHVLISWEGIES